MIGRAPTLADVITRALESKSTELRVALPARVERYDASKQLIDAHPLIKDEYFDWEDERHTHSLPVVTNIPVVFPGAGGFRLTFPVQVGDTVLLVFSDRSLDRWLDSGGDVDPVDNRQHSLADAIAIPGLRPFSNPVTGASTSDATIGKDGGPQIVMKEAEIHLGADSSVPATEPVIKGATYRTAEDQLLSNLALALTQAGTALTAAGPLTLLPPAGASITAAGAALNTIAAYISTFQTGGPQYLSTIVKTK